MSLRRRTTVVAVVGLTLAGLAATAARGAPPPDPAVGTGAAAAAAGPTGTLTLLTGDRVRFRRSGDAVQVVGTVPRRDRAPRPLVHQRIAGDDYVIPADALPLLVSGRLDRRLFDVTTLVRDGYDDAHRSDTPLLVAPAAGAHPNTAGALPGARVRASLDAVHLTAVAAAKTPTYWRSLTGGAALPRTLAGGIAKVWLDGQVHATLDQSVPQIGGPTAWRHGDTGRGVKVAILDTGYDHAHPDFAGRVLAAKDFTDSKTGSTQDGNGHGTHVSSIAAGSGAASHGRYKGVAYGASLLEGKVLADNGFGPESGILAGMQWAAEQGARVVNMSLGSGPDDGKSDPLDLAINSLTAKYGTLFVVAAGNDGVAGTVGSPSTADAALSVASVTKSDRRSYFSSQGPRDGDGGLKPDIAAPGSDIVAARAHGLLPAEAVDAYYARLDGTSMASPHVAGAAALLAAEHPTWKAPQLKAALMSTAHPIPGTDVYGQGTGRVDVARAYTQPVWADGSDFLGQLAWPYAKDAPVTKPVTYHNDGSRPVTLRLALRVPGAPTGLITLGAGRVTVPAHGTAAVTVTDHPDRARVGDFAGTVTATAPHVLLHTSVGTSAAAETYTVSQRSVDRAGRPGLGFGILQNERTGDSYGTYDFGSEHLDASVPPGTYRVLGQVIDADFVTTSSTFIARRIEVRADTVVTLDARGGKPVRVTVPPAGARSQWDYNVVAESSIVHGAGTLNGGGLGDHLYAIGGPAMPGLDFLVATVWRQPQVALSVPQLPGVGFDLLDQANRPFRGKVSGRIVDVGRGSAADLAGKDLHGAIVLYQPTTGDSQTVRRARVTAFAAAGARLVLFTGEDYIEEEPPLDVPVVWVLNPSQAAQLVHAVDAGATGTVTGIRSSPYAYFLVDRSRGRLPDGITFAHRDGALATLRSTFHSTRDADAYQPIQFEWQGYGLISDYLTDTRAPSALVQHLSPGVRWGFAVDPPAFDRDKFGLAIQVGAVRAYRAGSVTAEEWNEAPFSPQFPTPPIDPQDGRPDPWVYRAANHVSVDVPLFSDSTGRHFSPLDYNPYATPADPSPPDFHPDSGSTVLWRNGRKVGSSDEPGVARFAVPAGNGRYRLVVDGTRGDPDVFLSRQVHAEWTFGSGPTPGQRRVALPLMSVRWALGLDGTDSVRAHSRLPVRLSVAHQPGAPSPTVTGLRLWVSADHGRHWAAVRTHGAGDRWRAVLPATAKGSVSLRASTVDHSGNTFTETVIDAYRAR